MGGVLAAKWMTRLVNAPARTIGAVSRKDAGAESLVSDDAPGANIIWFARARAGDGHPLANAIDLRRSTASIASRLMLAVAGSPSTLLRARAACRLQDPKGLASGADRDDGTNSSVASDPVWRLVGVTGRSAARRGGCRGRLRCLEPAAGSVWRRRGLRTPDAQPMGLRRGFLAPRSGGAQGRLCRSGIRIVSCGRGPVLILSESRYGRA